MLRPAASMRSNRRAPRIGPTNSGWRNLIGTGVLVCAATTWVWQHTADARTQVDDAQRSLIAERGKIAANIQQLQTRLAAASHRGADLQAALDEVRRSKTSQPTQPTSSTGPARSGGSPSTSAVTAALMRENLFKEPRLQALYLNSGRSRLASEFGPFYVTQRLSPEQVEQFEVAMLRRQEQLMDLAAIGESQGAEGRSAVATLQKQIREENDAALRAILGAESLRQMQDYQRAASPRMFVKQLAGTAVVEGEPLNAQQAERLTQVLANASARYPTGGGADLRAIDWDAADAQAQSVLTPMQFELFKNARTRAEMQLDAALQRALEREAARMRSGG